MLKLHFKDNSQPSFWVTDKLYAIGSASDNQLVILNDEMVDKLHAKLIAEDNKFLLKDNNSSHGCFINGQRITQKEILPGDIIKFGNTELIVLDPRRLQYDGDQMQAAPWRLVSDSSWLPGKTFIIPADRTVTVGRADQCEISIPGTHLSRKHTELRVQGAKLLITDLGSANGTYLNDQLVSEGIAYNGDRLRLDVYTFRIVAPDTEENKTRIRPPADALNKPVERKQISTEPKRWITKPTSPGNRIEVVDGPPIATLWKWGAIVVTLLVAIIAIKFLW